MTTRTRINRKKNKKRKKVHIDVAIEPEGKKKMGNSQIRNIKLVSSTN